jgi:hypothetical protein
MLATQFPVWVCGVWNPALSFVPAHSTLRIRSSDNGWAWPFWITSLRSSGQWQDSPEVCWPVMVSRFIFLALPLTRQPVRAVKGVCCVWCVVFVASFVASSDYGCRWAVVGGLFIWLPFVLNIDQYHSCLLRQLNTALSLNWLHRSQKRAPTMCWV